MGSQSDETGGRTVLNWQSNEDYRCPFLRPAYVERLRDREEKLRSLDRVLVVRNRAAHADQHRTTYTLAHKLSLHSLFRPCPLLRPRSPTPKGHGRASGEKRVKPTQEKDIRTEAEEERIRILCQLRG